MMSWIPRCFSLACGLLFFVFTTFAECGARDDDQVDLEINANRSEVGQSPRVSGKRRQCPRYWGGGSTGCAQHCTCRYLEVCLHNECYLSCQVVGAIALTLVGILTVITIVRSQQHIDGEEGFYQAALYIRDAMEGVRRPHPRETWWARRCYAFHMQHVPCLRFYAWILLCLTCWELPTWCEVQKYEFNGERLCESDLYPSYPIPYMTHNKHVVLEFVFLLPFILDVILIGYSQGARFCTSWTNILRVFLLVLNSGDTLCAYLDHRNAVRLGHYIRLSFLLDHNHELRKIFELVLRILPNIMSIFFLMFSFISLFAFVGCVLFPRDTEEGGQIFPNFLEGQWNLLILITTANFPDVMMPAYREGRSAFLFFFIFIVFGIWFLVNITTATVVETYDEQLSADLLQKAELEASSMDLAYEALSASSPPTQEKLVQFFGELPSRTSTLTHVKKANLHSMVASLNVDGNDTISRDEFTALAPILRQRAEVAFPPPLLERLIPSVANKAWWIAAKHFVHSRRLDKIINAIIIFAFVLMVREHWEEFMGKPPVKDWWDTIRRRLEYSFCVIYTLEMLLKILVLSFTRFWHHVKHRFDLFCTVLAIILLMISKFESEQTLQSIVSLIRIPRLLSVFTEIQTFRDIADTFAEVASKVTSVVGFLMGTMYLFSVAGCDLFGGVINLDERSPHYKEVFSSDFGEAQYWENNFNDVPSGMVTLFELIVVNNWQVITSGFEAACGKQARIFFIVFHVFGVLIIFNIVLAIVLDTFENSYIRSEHTEGKELSAEVRIHLYEDALRKIGVDPVMIENEAAAAKRVEDDED